ncbi:PAS domain-containing protein [Polynucleobacter paneuropaeus]|nr:PAS domain-containing protein [Polynucleobacter paneuropaeus]
MFKRWYQSSLRHQILIWLLVINFFILLLVAVATLQVSRSSVEKNIFEQLEREHVIESEMIEDSLNRMVEEVQSLSSSPTMISVLNSPDKVDQLLEAFAKRNPLIKEDRDDFYLLDANLNRLYVIGSPNSWVDGSRALAKSALSQLKIQAGVFKTASGYILQLAQPVEARGVVVISQPINQLLGRFFQGRKDIAAWVLEDGSGQVLSNLSGGASPDQTMVRELFGDLTKKNIAPSSPADSESNVHPWKTIRGPLRLVPPLASLHLQLALNERTNWTHIVAMELLLPFILVFLLVSLLAFIIITIVGRRLASPIEELASYALSIEGSGFSSVENQAKLASLVQRPDEVGRLSAQFSQMLGRLRHSYVGLEDQVAQRNAQLEAVFDLSPDGFIDLDAQGVVRFVNPAFQILTSLSAIEVVGHPTSMLIEKLHALTSNVTLSQLQEILRATEQFHWLELNIPYKRTLLVLTKLNDEDGCVVYLRDITQEAELEEMRSTFMSTAAHELRTPISSILGYAELLMRRLKGGVKPSEEMIVEMASVIERQSKNMADLVNDLLDLSRLENQVAKGLNMHETALATYLRPVVSQFQMPGDSREVVMYFDDHLPEVQLHPESFKRLIVNLLGNAFKYSSKGSPVIVKTFTQEITDKLYVGVSIKDFGDGMSAEDLAHAFERFYRSSAYELIPGTGLGLAIAKEIMQAHSGVIDIQSELGQGTTVTLLFPAIRTWGR